MFRYISYPDTLHSPLCAEWASRLVPTSPGADAIRYAEANKLLLHTHMTDPMNGDSLLLGILTFVPERVYLRMRTPRIPSGHGGMDSFILERTQNASYIWVRSDDGILWEAPDHWYQERQYFLDIAFLAQLLMGDITARPRSPHRGDVSGGILKLIEKKAPKPGKHTVFTRKTLENNL